MIIQTIFCLVMILIIYKEKQLKKEVVFYIKNTYRANCVTISSGDAEFLSVKILQTEIKSFLISCCDRALRGDAGNFNTYLERIFHSNKKEIKIYFILGYLCLNWRNYDINFDIKRFCDNIFQRDMVKHELGVTIASYELLVTS